jgi:tetratricopeptide (TPR) repeat protein
MKAIVSGAAFALLSALSPIAAQEAGHHDHAAGAHGGERIGTVSFANSGSPAAQRPFLRGLALLHSFEYDDARAEFRDAERADSGFAMAYWGEALTFAQLLWGIDYADSARAALARFGATRDARLARAKTERERLYGVAVEALFDTTSLESRVRGYVAGLRAVRAAQPNDLDARAFLAVGLMMDDSGTPADQKARTEESIALAQSVFAAAPQHPGGAHYLIHAADNPKYAAKGLAAARAYAKIAPDAEHALHMPSHIFVQVGAWDDVVSSNERAWPASRAWVKSHAMPNTELSFHSLWWLQYGYLQQGRFAAAKALLDTVRMTLAGTDWATSEATDARHAELQFSYLYARETGDWSVYGGRTPGPSSSIRSCPANACSSSRRRRRRAVRSSRRCWATRRRRSCCSIRFRSAQRSRVARSLGCWRRRAATRRTGSRRSRRWRSSTRASGTSVRRAAIRPPSCSAMRSSPPAGRRMRSSRIGSSSS